MPYSRSEKNVALYSDRLAILFCIDPARRDYQPLTSSRHDADIEPDEDGLDVERIWRKRTSGRSWSLSESDFP